MRPELNQILSYDPRESDFYYEEIPETLKSDKNQKYASDMNEMFDLLAQTKHDKLVEKIINKEQMELEIAEFEEFNFGGKK
jgi:hypothetical protein